MRPDKKASALDGVPMHCPALIQAEKLQKKAAKLGFDWSRQEEIVDKIQEELNELREAMKSGDEAHIDEELGDLLFAASNPFPFPQTPVGGTSAWRREQKVQDPFHVHGKRACGTGKEVRGLQYR